MSGIPWEHFYFTNSRDSDCYAIFYVIHGSPAAGQGQCLVWEKLPWDTERGIHGSPAAGQGQCLVGAKLPWDTERGIHGSPAAGQGQCLVGAKLPWDTEN